MPSVGVELFEAGGGVRVGQQRVHSSMKFYWEMVENYYTTPFMEVFLEPRTLLGRPLTVR